MAHDLHEAITKARLCEPIAVEMIDFPEERGTVGFNINDGRK